MGAIAGLLGLGGGSAGTSFQGPQSASILTGVNEGQAGTAYQGTQNSLASQQALLAALQGQNGIGNQSNVFNQQQALANQLGGANAVGNQTAALQALQGLAGQQQGLAGQYQNLANGVGPNPAQTQLAQNTAANVAQTGALMAGQRGASQNVGLIARQAGQQGAQTQQQLAGQAATLQAQQQIAGMQGLASQQQAIGQTQQASAAIAAQQLAAQQAQQQELSGTAAGQVGNIVGQTNANVGANQAQYGNVLNAIGAANNANISNQSNINNVNAGLANTQLQGQQGVVGGIFNAGAGLMALAGGGQIEKMASGGYPGQSSFGQFLSTVGVPGMASMASPSFTSDEAGANALNNGIGKFGGLGKSRHAGATDLPDMSDLGALALAAKGGDLKKDLRTGGRVVASGGAEKAVKKGDDYSNDKIPAVLSEHEIVLPRSVTMSRDPVGNAAKFVAQILAQRGKK